MSKEAKVVAPINGGVQTTVEESMVLVESIIESPYGETQAQLRQTVESVSIYPKKRIANSLSQNIFSAEEFGASSEEYVNTENRVAWITVPEGLTVDDVQARMDQFPNARLYRMLSHMPLLTQEQSYAIDSDEYDITMDDIANRQVVRDDKGDIVLHNGLPQYRQIFFSAEGFHDLDGRPDTKDEPYYTPQIESELNTEKKSNHVVVGKQRLAEEVEEAPQKKTVGKREMVRKPR